MKRRALLAAAAALPGAALAQDRPLRIVVPFAPGGSSDVLARLLQPGLQAALGQTVVVDNRPGAGSLLGAEAVAHAAADGTTVLLADLPFAIVPAVQERMPYDPVADFAPVTQLASAPLILFVNAAVPARDAVEFAALARARPERFSYGSGGVGRRLPPAGGAVPARHRAAPGWCMCPIAAAARRCWMPPPARSRRSS